MKLIHFIILMNLIIYPDNIWAQDYCMKIDQSKNFNKSGKLVYTDNAINYTKSLTLYPDSTFEYSFDRCGPCDLTWGKWTFENDSIIILNGDYHLSDSLIKEKRRSINWYNYRHYRPKNNKKLFIINNKVCVLNLASPNHVSSLIKNANKINYEIDTTLDNRIKCHIEIIGIESDSIFSPGEGKIQSINLQEDGNVVFIRFGKDLIFFYQNFSCVNVEPKESIKTGQLIGTILNDMKIVILSHKNDIGFNKIIKALKYYNNND